MGHIKEIKVDEFVRRLKNLMNDHDDSKFVFFLGAGCSVSSGIPCAGPLVRNWLPKLKKVKTGNEDNIESWLKDEYPDYEKESASLFYGKVIEDLFLTAEERQREVERLTERKDPGFGYAVLAQIMTHEKYCRHCNVMLTVNFDDLIADALYLYTQKKPVVISHESLAGFVRITGTRPLIIKLHGDARLEPKNTELETEKLAEAVRKVLKDLLCEMGLVFVGYGGHDHSVAEILEELPPRALPWGIYWVGGKIPDGKIGKWLEKRDAVWVNHNDFDELMLRIWNEYGLSHPRKDRFDRLMGTYFETFKKLKGRIEAQPEREDRKLREALEKATREFGSWLAVALEAEKYKKEDPEKADRIYREGLQEFPHSVELLGRYAFFLHFICKDYDKAEEYYKKSLEEDFHNAVNLGNYATLLCDIRKDYDKAEEYYKKSLEEDPHNAINLGNYGNFLKNIRKDYDKDKAEEYYKKSLEEDPHYAINLGNYAGFLLAKGDENGFSFLEKAIDLARKDLLHLLHETVLLECLFYQYAHSKDVTLQENSLKEIKSLLKRGIRSPRWDLSKNVERALKEGHPQPDFLKKLARVISEELDIQELDEPSKGN